MPFEDDLSQIRPAYEKELEALAEHLKQFAAQWPDGARALALTEGMPSDPDMARLLEGFAWLTAKLQVRLNDGYESVCRQMLQLFYPDFLKPVPAVGVCQFDTDKIKNVVSVPKGTLFDLVEDGQPYSFQTCRDIHLPGVFIETIVMLAEPLPQDVCRIYPEARSAIRLTIKSTDSQQPVGENLASCLEFYANPGAIRANELLDVLFTSLTGLVIQVQDNMLALPADCVSWPLFAPGETLLPAAPEIFSAQKLLRDFVLAPDAFRFLSVDLSSLTGQLNDQEISLWFILDEASGGLEKYTGHSHFKTGCVPAINLYDAIADPVSLTHETRQVPLSLGQIHACARIYDIVSIKDVTRPDQPVVVPKLFHYSYGDMPTSMHWLFSPDQQRDFIQFSDCTPASDRKVKTLSVHCLAYDTGASGISSAASLKPSGSVLPTTGRLLNSTTCNRPDGLLSGDSWTLLSALQLNIRRFQTGRNEASLFHRVLEVFINDQSSLSHHSIRAVESLTCSRETRPCRSGNNYYIGQGTHFQISINAEKLHGFSIALFLNMVDRVLDFWRPFGSYSRLTVRLRRSNVAADRVIRFPEHNEE